MGNSHSEHLRRDKQILYLKDVGRSLKTFLLTLNSFSDVSGHCYPGIDLLAELLGLKIRRIYTLKGEAEQAGLILTGKTSCANSPNHNYYLLTLPDDPEKYLPSCNSKPAVESRIEDSKPVVESNQTCSGEQSNLKSRAPKEVLRGFEENLSPQAKNFAKRFTEHIKSFKPRRRTEIDKQTEYAQSLLDKGYTEIQLSGVLDFLRGTSKQGSFWKDKILSILTLTMKPQKDKKFFGYDNYMDAFLDLVENDQPSPTNSPFLGQQPRFLN